MKKIILSGIPFEVSDEMADAFNIELGITPSRMTADVISSHYPKITKLLEESKKGNDVAYEASSSLRLKIRLQNDGWSEVEGYPGHFVQNRLGRESDLMITQGKVAYLITEYRLMKE